MRRRLFSLVGVSAQVMVLAGCAASGSVSLSERVERETLRDLRKTCLTDHADQIMEMSQVDPTYLHRYCQHWAYRQIQRTRPPGSD